MDLHAILNDPAVLELKRRANDLREHPERLNVPASQGLTFPEAWQSVWKSFPDGQALQKQIFDRWGHGVSLLPQPDGSIAVSYSDSSTRPWGPTGELNVPHSQVDQSEIAATARAKAIDQTVKRVQAKYAGMSYAEAWAIAEADNRELFHPSSDFDADDYQLRHVYGVRG
jgi:hypothetical protein